MFDPSCPHNQCGYLWGLSWCWSTCLCRGREDKKTRLGDRALAWESEESWETTYHKRRISWGRKATFGHLVSSSLGFGSSREQRHRNWHFLLLPFLLEKKNVNFHSFFYSLLPSGFKMSLLLVLFLFLNSVKIPSTSRLLISYINHLVEEEPEAQGNDSSCRNGARMVLTTGPDTWPLQARAWCLRWGKVYSSLKGCQA